VQAAARLIAGFAVQRDEAAVDRPRVERKTPRSKIKKR